MKLHLRNSLETLLKSGTPHREIERRTRVDRKTIRRYARSAEEAESPGVATGSFDLFGQNPPPRPPALPKAAASACAAHSEWIKSQVALGRNAVSIYQDLVEGCGFTHKYNSVKRFVRAIKAREPERFDVLEFGPAEEAQVDYGQGALTLKANGKYARPYLFVMTLKYSGKSFRKVVWKTSQEIWAQLHEEAFRHFGGVVRYVVLDNLKEGVLTPDIYEPKLNPVYTAMLKHYGAVGDACRVQDPNRKGSVENAIKHTQSTALKGRKFDTIEAQNEWLAHWEERWAATRIHGRKKRQVMEMFLEEKPLLSPLPLESFRSFKHGTRTVDDAGLVQVEGSYYAALPAALYSTVTVRTYLREIEILDASGKVLRRHERSAEKGNFVMKNGDRLFNPSRESARLLHGAKSIGPHAAQLAVRVFERLGRPGQKAIYGLNNLVRHHGREAVEEACKEALDKQRPSYPAIKRILQTKADAKKLSAAAQPLKQEGPGIRQLTEYQAFWERHARAR